MGEIWVSICSLFSVFNQGDEGKSWYIILKGSVNVVIYGKVSYSWEPELCMYMDNEKHMEKVQYKVYKGIYRDNEFILFMVNRKRGFYDYGKLNLSTSFLMDSIVTMV